MRRRKTGGGEVEQEENRRTRRGTGGGEGEQEEEKENRRMRSRTG